MEQGGGAMELLQDGAVAALAAIGVTSLLWLAASLLLQWERPLTASYVVAVTGDAAGLDVTLRALARNRPLPVLLVDCGLTAEGRRAAELLCIGNVRLLTPSELASCYTNENLPE